MPEHTYYYIGLEDRRNKNGQVPHLRLCWCRRRAGARQMMRRVKRAPRKNPPVGGRQSRSELDDLYTQCTAAFVVTQFHITGQSTELNVKTYWTYSPKLLAGWEEPGKQDCDSCEDERGQDEERLLARTELEPGEGEVAKLEDLVKRTHPAACLDLATG